MRRYTLSSLFSFAICSKEDWFLLNIVGFKQSVEYLMYHLNKNKFDKLNTFRWKFLLYSNVDAYWNSLIDQGPYSSLSNVASRYIIGYAYMKWSVCCFVEAWKRSEICKENHFVKLFSVTSDISNGMVVSGEFFAHHPKFCL